MIVERTVCLLVCIYHVKVDAYIMYAPRMKQITFIYASPRRQRPQQRRNSPKSLHARQYTAKIKQSRSWQDAFDLHKETEANNIKPDHFHFSTAISVCARKDHWKQAIQLLKERTNRGVQPSVFCYNAAINACGRGFQWKKALALPRHMETDGLQPDVITYSSAISACKKSSQ